MSEVRIASRYARSLYSKAAESGAVETVAEDMTNLAAVLKESRDLNLFLESPLISRLDKKAAIAKIFSSFGQDSRSLFELMTERGRESLLPFVAQEFTRIYNSENKITEATVTSAAPLEDSTQKTIVEFIKSRTGAGKVLLNIHTDQSLIGGLTVLFDGKIYDSSILSQIKKLKKELNLA